MILKKEALFQMIQEEVIRQSKKQQIAKRIQEIVNEIAEIDSNSYMINEFQSSAITNFPANDVQQDADDDTMSFYEVKPGQALLLNFEGLTLKLSRQSDDVFKVMDGSQSKQLQDNDLIQVSLPQGHTGEHVWRKGSEYDFKFLTRNVGQRYHTNKLKSWEIVRI